MTGWSWLCERCWKPRTLFVTIGGKLTCGECWVRLGRPSLGAAPPDPAHETEVRERMLARGGADRHVVRSGRS